jgi:hypothetical protein
MFSDKLATLRRAPSTIAINCAWFIAAMFAIGTLGEARTISSESSENLAKKNQSAYGNQRTDDVFLEFSIGEVPSDGIMYLPLGWHFSERLSTETIYANNFLSITKNGLSASTFINSYGDRTWSIGISRTLLQGSAIGLEYSVGLMVGYDGRLSEIMPSSLQPLFEGNVNPYLVFFPYYQLTDNIELRGMYGPPNVVLVGVKYTF